jgi:hypothetical protein
MLGPRRSLLFALILSAIAVVRGEGFVALPNFDDRPCDVPRIGVEELEVNPAFPRDFSPLETIASTAVATPLRACLDALGGDGIANDWLVTITNLTGRDFVGLAFVADVGNSVGNADGTYALLSPFGSDLLSSTMGHGTLH